MMSPFFEAREFLRILPMAAVLLWTPHSFAQALPTSWEPRGVGGGGALMDPSFSPHDDRLFVACDMSPFFRSQDLGRHWTVVDHRELQGNRGSRVAFTSDPDRVYTIDHTYELPVPALSTDGGVTWSRLPAASWPGDRTAHVLFADTASTQRLVVGGDDTLWVSTDGGASFAARYQSASANGLHVAGAFFDGPTIYVGTSDGLLVSTNGGGSFAPGPSAGLPAGTGLISFAGARENGQVRLIASIADQADLYPGVFPEELFGDAFRGVYRLDPGTTAWVPANSGMNAADRPVLVAMAANDIDVAFAAGAANPSQGDAPVVYRTTDGAASWTTALFTTNNQNVTTGWAGHLGDRGWSYGGGLIGLGVAPHDSQRVAISDYGFVHVSEDGGAHWRQAYVDPRDQNVEGLATPQRRSYRTSGIENTSVWSLAWSDAQRVFAGFSDIRGIRSVDAGASWSFDYTGHGQNSMYRVVRHTDGTLYGATASIHDLYQSTYLTDARIDGAGGRVLRSTDQGATWSVVHDFGHAVAWIALDPADASRAYAAVAHSVDGGVWYTGNLEAGAASTWTRLPPPPRTEGHAYNVVALSDGALVASYSARRNSSGAFTPSSGVFFKASLAAPWEDRSAPGLIYWTKDVVVDPHDPTQSTWYAGVFSGFGGPSNGLGGVYRTANRGQSWTRINALDRVESVTVSPTNPDLAWVTTEADGLWSTQNLRSGAPTFAQDAAFPFRQPLRVFYNPHDTAEIWVTSFGNGLHVGRVQPLDEPLFADGFE